MRYTNNLSTPSRWHRSIFILILVTYYCFVFYFNVLSGKNLEIPSISKTYLLTWSDLQWFNTSYLSEIVAASSFRGFDLKCCPAKVNSSFHRLSAWLSLQIDNIGEALDGGMEEGFSTFKMARNLSWQQQIPFCRRSA